MPSLRPSHKPGTSLAASLAASLGSPRGEPEPPDATGCRRMRPDAAALAVALAAEKTPENRPQHGAAALRGGPPPRADTHPPRAGTHPPRSAAKHMHGQPAVAQVPALIEAATSPMLDLDARTGYRCTPAFKRQGPEATRSDKGHKRMVVFRTVPLPEHTVELWFVF